jgi:hypothetical protein
MAIHFSCERCGHPIDVDDHFAGQHGHCKHCGHATVVPVQSRADKEAAFQLRPLESDSHSASAERARVETKPGELYDVVGKDHSRARPGPPAMHGHPIVRLELKGLRTLRNWLYVVSVVGLGVAAYGYFYSFKQALHIGGVVVVAANIGMFVVGVFYLVLIPFKESLWHGLANLLIPFYAVYYWITRWPKVKKAVGNTVGSFVPILLVGLAYLAYKEAPVVVPIVEKEFEQIEQIEQRLEREIEPKTAPEGSSKPGPQGAPSP